MKAWQKIALMALMFLSGGAIGCGQSCSGTSASDPSAAQAVAASIGGGHAHVHTHDGWWCDEHGVPEDVCGQCNPKVAADCQKKGDWCAEHDRPESQCFICHPELEARFSAKYEAKFGKAPPQPEG